MKTQKRSTTRDSVAMHWPTAWYRWLALGLLAMPLALLLPESAAADVQIALSRTNDTIDDFPVADHELLTIRDGVTLGVILLDIPPSVDVVAYARDANGAQYFALDQTVDIGGLVIGPEDVVLLEQAGEVGGAAILSLALDGSLVGIPNGAVIDAMTLNPSDPARSLIISLDTTAFLPTEIGGAPGILIADDEDMLSTNGSGFFMALDGSEAGIPTAADVDGGHYVNEDDTWYLSFDTDVTVGELVFSDDDIASYDGGVWSVVQRIDGVGNDVDAVAATPTQILFADGFESGDTLAWN